MPYFHLNAPPPLPDRRQSYAWASPMAAFQ